MPQLTIKQEVAQTFKSSPVLWAVIKGYDTPTAIAARLGWTMERTLRECSQAHGHEKIRLNGERYLPVNQRHRRLKNLLGRQQKNRVASE